MNKRTECLSVMITKEERKALSSYLHELYIKEDKKVTVSDFMRGLLRNNLNGNAPPPDIIDDCVKEQLVKMEAEVNEQDDEQVNKDFWKGVTA